MKKFKEPKTIWLGKIKEGDGTYSGDYDMGTRKKDWGDFGFSGNSFLVEPFCEARFERITGIRLEDGELVKVEITVATARK